MSANATATEHKTKALELALASIEKAYGREAIMKLGEKSAKIQVDVISTGALPLDLAIGVGGLPRGRISEIYGPESSGKSTLALHVVAQAQKAGGVAAYIDAEHAMDPAYARKLGVDIENLLISQPDSGEQALEIVEKLVRSGAVDVIVVDSVAALVPQAEIEGEMGDAHVGLQARLMSQALRKLTHTISQTKTALLFINQIRHKIGVMFGNPETTPGGLALKFYASLRLDIRRIENIKQGEVVVGMRTRVKVVKNKMAPPYRIAEFEVIHGIGVSREGCIIDMGAEAGLIEKSGAWFLYKGERLGQGRENAKEYLKNASKTADEIEAALKAKFLAAKDGVAAGTRSAAAGKAEAPAKPEKPEAVSKAAPARDKAASR